MSSKPLSWKEKYYPKIWLILGVSLLLFSAILWIWLQLAARVTKERNFTDVDAEPQVVTVDRFPANLGSLTNIVSILDLSKAADKPDSAHSPEFKAAAFIGAHESEWTLQVMNVSQENVIIDFLAKRSDRARFQYFRYHNGEADQSFILTYGTFTTVETTMGALQTVSFGLPDSVKAFPERFSTYKPFVSDSDDVLISSSLNIQRQVNLRPVAIPPPIDTIEAKLAQISAQSATEPDGTSTLPSSVDGFSGEPDAPPLDPASANTTGQKVLPNTTVPSAIQDPFN
jgi:hypothetical protein